MEDNSEKIKEVVICKNNHFKFPNIEKTNGNVLFFGNLNGVCGDAKWDNEAGGSILKELNFSSFANTFGDNYYFIYNILNGGGKITIAASEETIDYFHDLMASILDMHFDERKTIRKMLNRQVQIFHADEKDGTKILKLFKDRGMKFDAIIQNPPFSGSLHLDFLKKGLDLLNENGKMAIIEPATWLINVRTNGKAEKYDEIKKRINGHVESVIIENFNDNFGIANDTPLAITTIDMSKTFDTIDFVVCGEHRTVKSVYDCNLIGDYNVIQSIFEKVQKYGDVFKNHIYKKGETNGLYFLRYWNYQLYALGSNYGNVVNQYNDKTIAVYRENNFGSFFSSYIDSLFYKEICDDIPKSTKKGKPCDCIFGNKKELENWIYNVNNCKLFVFLTIATIFDKNNNAKNILPWVANKQYTDKEIIEMFGFSEEEISLINKTIERFKYDSPWFKRYMCGLDSVSDEEINTFIEKL